MRSVEPDNGARPITDAQWAEIVGYCQAAGVQGKEVKDHIGAANLKVLTPAQFTAATDYLKGKVADKAKAASNAKGAE